MRSKEDNKALCDFFTSSTACSRDESFACKERLRPILVRKISLDAFRRLELPDHLFSARPFLPAEVAPLPFLQGGFVVRLSNDRVFILQERRAGKLGRQESLMDRMGVAGLVAAGIRMLVQRDCFCECTGSWTHR